MNLTNSLLDLYTIIILIIFGYTAYNTYIAADNYFSAFIIYLDDYQTNFLLYNLVLAVNILLYRLIVWVFFKQTKENQTIKIVDKLKHKIIDLVIFIYVTRGKINLQIFTCLVFLLLMFIVHYHAIYRSEYLIHTPSIGNLNLNFRLVGLLLLLFFIDYQVWKHSIQWLFSNDQTVLFFVYYFLSMSLSIVDSSLKFFVDFYEKYTLISIPNSQQTLVMLGIFITIPKLIFQMILAFWIAIQLNVYFLFFIILFELYSQLTTTITTYKGIRKLTESMKNLKKLTQQDLNQMHDKTCMICFIDMKNGVLLPCKHAFHQQCLRQWILKNSNHFCPKCKKSFDFEENNQSGEEVLARMLRRVNAQAQNERIQRIQRPERIQNFRKFQENIKSYKNQQKGIKTDVRQYEKQPEQLQADEYQLELPVSLNYIYKKQRNGCLPYCFPTEAVYHRNQIDMKNRNRAIAKNIRLIKNFIGKPHQQLLKMPDL